MRVCRYLTVREARSHAKAACDDFGALWWLLAVQTAMADSERRHFHAMLKELQHPSFRTCLLGWVIGFLHDNTALSNYFEDKIQILFDQRRFDGDFVRQVGVSEGVDGIFENMDQSVVIREIDLKKQEACMKIRKMLSYCQEPEREALKAIWATKTLMVVTALAPLCHSAQRFMNVVNAKISEFKSIREHKDERTYRIMKPIYEHVEPTLFQSPLDAWIDVIVARRAQKN